MYGSRFGWGGYPSVYLGNNWGGYNPRGYLGAGIGYPYQGGYGSPYWGYPGYCGGYGYPYFY